MIKKVMTLAAIIMFGIVNLAGAVVMTFDDIIYTEPDIESFTSYSEVGFEIKTALFGSRLNSSSVFINAVNYDATLSATDGSLFTLNSIDLNTLYDNTTAPVSFRAYDANNYLIATEGTTLTTDGWMTFEFSDAFSNVDRVMWSQVSQFHQFDNITLNETGDAPAPVPEPATVLLLGCGLIGLAGYKKYKKV